MLEVTSTGVQKPSFRANPPAISGQQARLPQMDRDTLELIRAKRKAKQDDTWRKVGIGASVLAALAMIAGVVYSIKTHRKISTEGNVSPGGILPPQTSKPRKSNFDLNRLEFLDLKENDSIGDIRNTKTLNKNTQNFFVKLLDNSKINKKYLDAAGAKDLPLPNAVLLFGPPGAGKTEAVKMYAKAAGSDLTIIKLGDFANSYVDGTATNMLNMFKALKERAEQNPDKELTILFDEIDGLARKLEHIGSDKEYLGKNRQSFITGIDMIRSLPNVKMFGTTNAAKTELDEAVISRFGNNTTFSPPTLEQLREGLKFHLRHNTEIPKNFYDENNKTLNAFLQSMVDKKGSYRDLATVVQGAIPKHAKVMNDNKAFSEFKVEYLEDALKEMGTLSGEIAA